MKKLTYVLVLAAVLFAYGNCARSADVIIVWDANTELDMSKYYVYFWTGADTLLAEFIYIKEVPHVAGADSIWTTVQAPAYPALVEGQWMRAGVRAVDLGSNSSDMTASKFYQIKDEHPSRPAYIRLWQ